MIGLFTPYEKKIVILIAEGHGVLQTGDAVVANVKEGVFKSPGIYPHLMMLLWFWCHFYCISAEIYCFLQVINRSK